MLSNPLNLTYADGIIEFDINRLARDPSTIVAYPYPPGGDYFYVDDLLQIGVGSKIFFDTEAENRPQDIARAMVELTKARRELKKYSEGNPIFDHWQAEVNRLCQTVMDYLQGHQYLKSLRMVDYVDRSRNLIVVRESFKHGYKPKVLGAVVRVLGNENDFINEIATDKLEKEAKKIYGSSWEDDIKTSGIISPSAA